MFKSFCIGFCYPPPAGKFLGEAALILCMAMIFIVLIGTLLYYVEKA